MTRILLMFLFLSSPSFAANIHHSTKALIHLSKCLPSQNIECILNANGCTQAQFCASCTAISSAKSSSCTDKPYAFAGLEGLYNQREGACKELCGSGATVSDIRPRSDIQSGETLVVSSHLDDGSLIAVRNINGLIEMVPVSYDGPKKPIGSIIQITKDAVSAPIAKEASCIKGNADSKLAQCFQKPGSCGRVFAKKADRCLSCAAISSCSDDFKSLFTSLTQVSLCGGC